jgi:hypothetical protein
MAIDLQPYVIPAHWICALVNDDFTGLDDAEDSIVRRFISDLGSRYLFVSPSDDDSYFTRCHDARDYGIPACDCMAVEIAFEPEPEPDYDADDAICNLYNSTVLESFVG